MLCHQKRATRAPAHTTTSSSFITVPVRLVGAAERFARATEVLADPGIVATVPTAPTGVMVRHWQEPPWRHLSWVWAGGAEIITNGQKAASPSACQRG